MTVLRNQHLTCHSEGNPLDLPAKSRMIQTKTAGNLFPSPNVGR